MSYFCTYQQQIMGTRIFKRKIYDQILNWKREKQGKTALLIEGARRVGKSTIVEEFAKNEYDSYILVDFNKTTKAIRDLFEDLSDMNYIFLTLQTTFHTSLVERKSLIIFDEVQKCPLARQAIKYLVADGRYDYIETGSLISIKKNTKDITIPSEEDRIQMNPMDYEEFRWALGDTSTIPLLRQYWDSKHALGAAHRTAMRDLRLYMLVGGMPQAVNEYIETNDFQKVDVIKRSIISLYEDDFRKIDASGRITKMFRSIPDMLNRNVTRYQTTSVVGRVSDNKMTDLLVDLEDSKTVNFAYQCDDPNVGMGLTKNEEVYKLFLADTGLFVTLAFWDKDFTENVIYQKLLSDKLSANLGYVYENLIAQMLVAAGNKLFYHTWPKDSKHNYEIDFLISRENKVCPIEVKSSGYKAHASLDAFCQQYSDRIRWRYLVYTKDYSHDEEVQMVPAYMVPFL